MVATIEQVKQLIYSNNDDIILSESHPEDINKKYAETEQSIDAKYHEINMNANKYRDEAKTKLFGKKQQQKHLS